MSGPKGMSYSVSAEELARQAALDRARARCAMLSDAVVGILIELRHLGGQPSLVPRAPVISADMSEADADRAAEDYVGQMQRLEQHLILLRRRRVDDAFAAVEGASTVATLTMDGFRMSPVPDQTRAATRDVARPPSEILSAVASALGSLREEGIREKWLAEAVELAERDDGPARDRLESLRLAAEAEVRRERRAAELRSDVEEILVSIADVETAEADELRAALRALTDRTGLGQLAVRAAQVEARWREDAARRYVIARTAAALAEMGHRIAGDFTVSADRGESALALRAGDPDYATQVRFLPGSRTLLVNTVSLRSESSVAQDTAAEEQMCEVVDQVVRRLGEDGVSLVKTHGRRPGEVPIQRRVVSSSSEPAAASRQRTSSIDIQRPASRGSSR